MPLLPFLLTLLVIYRIVTFPGKILVCLVPTTWDNRRDELDGGLINVGLNGKERAFLIFKPIFKIFSELSINVTTMR